MPNLLKSLPREILATEDSKFIYNVLNPLLFEKIKETNQITRKEFPAIDMVGIKIEDIEQTNFDYNIPFNIDSRDFQVYLDDSNTKTKVERYSDTSLINELDDIKSYMFHYFNFEGYEFIKPIVGSYFYIKSELEKNERLYITNYKKYMDIVDVKQKQILKQTYLFFKATYDSYLTMFQEFDLIFHSLSEYNMYSINQIVTNISTNIANNIGIKSFDEDLIFSKSSLFGYLTDTITFEETINKHTFVGNKITSTVEYKPTHIIELMAIFALELSTIKNKYSSYQSLLVDNGTNGYALHKNSMKKMKNKTFNNVVIDLDSDNLTFDLNIETNTLEVYIYFEKSISINEELFNLTINGEVINKSLVSLEGNINQGYSLFNYMDETTKYYKITVREYLIIDSEGGYFNNEIDSIEITFDAVEKLYTTLLAISPILETTQFIDNFQIYRKNDSGFLEEFKVPYEVKIDLIEKEERYTRSYEFFGIDASSNNSIASEKELVISYCVYNYDYTPKVYIDLFNNQTSTINFRYTTLVEYVLLDDIMDKEYTVPYYGIMHVANKEFNSDIYKNTLMSNGAVYKKLFNTTKSVVLMNPYNETRVDYINKMSHEQYEVREHTRETKIQTIINSAPYIENVKHINKFQYDAARHAIIFMYRGFQYIVPIDETLLRDKNYEQLDFNRETTTIFYRNQILHSSWFIFENKKIYVKNINTGVNELLELVPTVSMSSEFDEVIFYDILNKCHSIIIEGVNYRIDNLYLASNEEALAYEGAVFYIERIFGVPRYKDNQGNIVDVDIYTEINQPQNGKITLDVESKTLAYKNEEVDYKFELTEIIQKQNLHKSAGLNTFSLFYAGNVLPENSNKTFFGRENIYSSMFMADNIYAIGETEDRIDDTQQHKLIAEQLDLDVRKAPKYNIEVEPYIMSKTSTASLKGLESYLRSNLKSLSQDINVSPVYLVQRNRFISEWSKVSTVMPSNYFAEESLRGLVADLMETKLVQGAYDDLIDIFKANKYEKFSIATNNIHNVLVLYLQRYITESFLEEEFEHYLIHDVWLRKKRKQVMEFILQTATDSEIKVLDSLSFDRMIDKERFFYMFILALEAQDKITIDSYKPIANYSDWIDVTENNHVHFEKPFKYEIINVSEFIDLPIDWDEPLLMIRPLVDDGVYVKRDYRFLDSSMITNSLISNIDLYNEFLEEDVQKLSKTINYTLMTLETLYTLSLDGSFDYMSINLIIVKWVVERFLPNYVLTNKVDTVEEMTEVIKTELLSAEHPNLIVEYNKIKESVLLGDLGSNVTEMYDSITESELLQNSIIELEISDSTELAYLDKIKKPVEHYFDYLFSIERHDIITKVLALFTEDVIASSMIDLSLAINIKNTKGDETFDIYEKMINELFEDFMPFHSVIDKILFSIKIMETSSVDAVSKQADVLTKDLNYIDILSIHSEKIRIQTLDSSIVTTRVNVLFPSEGAKSCRDYELPHDYSRSIKMAGHSLFGHDSEEVGMDDEWYIDENNYSRALEIYTPPEFAENHWMCIPEKDYEQITDIYITEYYHIKEDILFQPERVESHFIDFVPTIEITQGIVQDAEVTLTEDYLIAIDATFNIQFYDMENQGHGDYGHGMVGGPEDQYALIGMREQFTHDVLHDFYEKLNLTVSDTIWTDIKVVYDLLDIPGHDDFGVDEMYHQQDPSNLDQEMSVMVYDELLQQGFNTTVVDMSDISLVDKLIARVVASEKDSTEIQVIDSLHTTIAIVTGRTNNGAYVLDGAFIQAGHNEFLHDEYYHNSDEWERLANMVDISLIDFLGDIRIDFGFMRLLPTDPYQDLIDQKFYRIDQPGSEVQTSRIRDKFTTNVHTFGKDFIRVNLLDVTMISIISEDIRRTIYNGIEQEEFGGDLFDVQFTESLVSRHIHHDFRENIVALDKYASVLDDVAILAIFGTRAANIERDELFELRLGDSLVADIKVKAPVDRMMTRIDKDYLKSIKIEEDNFVSLKYMDKELKVRLVENLSTYYQFNELSRVFLTETLKQNISSTNEETSSITMFDKLHYGDKTEFVIDGMALVASDELISVLNNRIYRDSMVMSITDSTEITEVMNSYDFGSERTLQEHDMYGHMGYTDESIDRTIESKISDSLLTRLDFVNKEEAYTTVYDSLMRNIDWYFGEVATVVISDSLKTYIDIVKKPWIWPEFDEFGHDDQPHMYHGDSDEFGITTQLRDQIKIDADTFIYNAGALVNMSESINITLNMETKVDNTISVSMVDDLKVVSFGFKDSITIMTSDIQDLSKTVSEEPLNIIISDKVWYGFKLQEDRPLIETSDEIIDYGYSDSVYRDIKVRTEIRDWLLFKLNFEENRLYTSITEKTIIINTNLFDKDSLSIGINETLSIHETSYNPFKDNTTVSLTDKLSVESTELEAGATSTDKIEIGVSETLSYGPGKWFNDKVRGYIQNRLSIYEETEEGPLVDITLEDNFHMYATTATFRDSIGVASYERMKFGLILTDKLDVSILRDNHLKIARGWFVNRFGVDEVVHSDLQQEWEDDFSVENSATTQLFDDVVLLDTHLIFIDRLDILSQENMAIADDVISSKDGIIISSSDNLMYGVGMYDYVWDAKEWDNYGYEVPYEAWDGLVPHDDFAHDEMEHQQQGDDLSQITTGVTENLLYGFDHLFKDSISVSTIDSGGFSNWGYQSLFKETVSVWLENRLQSSYADTDDALVNIQMRKEQMSISYDFDDKTKTHLYTEENGISKEEINIYDVETQQLIESIFKYRIYEKIDVEINQNLLTTALFKYDEEISLITDYNTKIDLYKERSDGSLAKSMTVIKDSSSSNVTLFFGDFINAVASDSIQGTEALRPNEYIE